MNSLIKKVSLLTVLVLATFSLKAKVNGDSLQVSVRPYVGLRGQIAAYNSELEIQENASRFGVELNVERKSITFLAAVEFQMNMFKGNSSFNLDGNLSGGFLTVQSQQSQQVFGNRLGYIGLDFGKYGKITIGKQWSVYRDITVYTDRFNVFGARASATFVGGTDGGENGTGRADKSLIYRTKLGPLYVGSQIQMRGGNNSKAIDGFGFSAQIKLSRETSLGAAFNRAFISSDLLNSGLILGLKGHPSYFSVGAIHVGKKIELSALYIIQQNGDFVQGRLDNSNLRPTVVFNAKGTELFAKYKFEKFHILAGYQLYKPNSDRILSQEGHIYSGFKRSDVIAGISYHPLKQVQFYAEQRLSSGKTSAAEKEDSIFTLGMKMDLSTKINKLL